MKYFWVHAILLNYVDVFWFPEVSNIIERIISLCTVIISLYVLHSTYIRSLCTKKKFQENSCLFPLSVGRKTEEGTGVAVERKIEGTVNS